jgi:hypothetical protein
VRMTFQAAERGENDRAARLVDEFRDVLGEDRPARKAYLLSEAVRTLRRLHDGRTEVWANEVLTLLDDPSFDEEYAVPAILARLAEAEQDPGRLLATAAGVHNGYWRRRAVTAVAARGQ